MLGRVALAGKFASFTVRTKPEVRHAMEKAAKADQRTLTNWVETMIVRTLREQGFLREEADTP